MFVSLFQSCCVLHGFIGAYSLFWYGGQQGCETPLNEVIHTPVWGVDVGWPPARSLEYNLRKFFTLFIRNPAFGAFSQSEYSLDNCQYSKVQVYIEDMKISPYYRCYLQELKVSACPYRAAAAACIRADEIGLFAKANTD
jgi:hypothetical protein